MFNVTFIIAVRNEAARLPRVLESIRNQDYDQKAIEILVVDGHSTDRTREIAGEWGCRIILNDLIRAEPGIAMAYKAAIGDIAIILAADNILHDGNFLNEIVKPFDDSRIMAAMPYVLSTEEDDSDLTYFNTFSDPFNHFLYWDAVSPRTFKHYYPIKRQTEAYSVYDFTNRDMPILALAQGMAIRCNLERQSSMDEDDIAPVIALIDAGHDIACLHSAYVEHHSAANGEHLIEKFRPRLRDRLIHRDRPIWDRSVRWSASQRLRFAFWPFYGISYILPWCVSRYRCRRDREPAWLTHASFSYRFALMMWHVAITEAVPKLMERLIAKPQH